MRQYKHIIISGLILSSLIACGQERDHNRMTKESANSILNESLSDSNIHNVIGSKSILTDKVKAVKFAEMILFNQYGKKNIENQKPYDVFVIGEYWLISGTLPIGMKGGTFLIIIDSRNCQIIRLSHGK